MFSFLITSRIKPADDYQWFTYKGNKPTSVSFRGHSVTIDKGQRFGVRPSSNKKDIRLVLDGDINRVITLTLDQAQKLSRNIASEA